MRAEYLTDNTLQIIPQIIQKDCAFSSKSMGKSLKTFEQGDHIDHISTSSFGTTGNPYGKSTNFNLNAHFIK